MFNFPVTLLATILSLISNLIHAQQTSASTTSLAPYANATSTNTSTLSYVYLANNCSNTAYFWTLDGLNGVSKMYTLLPNRETAEARLPQPLGTLSFSIVFAVQTNFEEAGALNQTEAVHFTVPAPAGPASVAYSMDRAAGVPPYEQNGSAQVLGTTGTKMTATGENCSSCGTWLQANVEKIGGGNVCPLHCDLEIGLCTWQ